MSGTRTRSFLRRVPFFVACAAVVAGCGTTKTSFGPEVDPLSRDAAENCDLDASPSTLVAVVDDAPGGSRICLEDGSYGTFAGLAKAERVTLRAKPDAQPRMQLAFKDAANLTLEGLTIEGATLSDRTRDITIKDSTFTAHAVIRDLASANVLFLRDRFVDIDATADSPPARITLGYSSSKHSGVTIRDSLFAGGDADGVQSGVGVDIVGNEFRDILEKGGPNHTDAIQLIGAPGSVIRGNYIRDCATGIVAFDGLKRAVIEHNVIDLTGKGKRPWGIEVYSDDGSRIRSNTLRHDVNCSWDSACGLIDINRKPGSPPSRGTVVVNNVATGILVQGGSQLSERHHNLLRQEPAGGDRSGAPTFAGGASPRRYKDFRLADRSAGKGAGLGGADPGIGSQGR